MLLKIIINFPKIFVFYDVWNKSSDNCNVYSFTNMEINIEEIILRKQVTSFSTKH